MVAQIFDSHCSKCRGITHHEVLHHERREWTHKASFEWSENDYRFLKCCGCGTISFRHDELTSEYTDPDGDAVPRTRYYPPAVSRHNPPWLNDLLLDLTLEEWHLHALLGEIYAAAQNDLRGLATMGVRALLEKIMVAKVGDQGTFTKHLAAFEAAGFVSKVQREYLETILEAGHAAMHRVYTPSVADLNALLDITESIVESIYLHRSAIERVKKSIPARKPK